MKQGFVLESCFQIFVAQITVFIAQIHLKRKFTCWARQSHYKSTCSKDSSNKKREPCNISGIAQIKRKIHRKRLQVIHRKSYLKVMSVQYQVQENIPINNQKEMNNHSKANKNFGSIIYFHTFFFRRSRSNIFST